jgi:pimeloyl-ACP methyl ester carboxylesterase
MGVLEPLQTATSIEGQLQELRAVLEKHADLPVTLAGFSWGAWLSFIFAARYPSLVGKLILISSGPFEEQYAAAIMKTRLSRLSPEERSEVESIAEALDNTAISEKNNLFARLGRLIYKADSCNPLPHESEPIKYSYAIYHSVWQEASKLRSNGQLLALGKKILCPVVAIHGDYDPHPDDGVREPLSRVLPDFRFILLEHCGHYPWRERVASEKFYRLLSREFLE